MPTLQRLKAPPTAKARAAASRKLRKTSTVKFRARGPFKCVVNDGKSCKGVHPALKARLFPSWDYKQAQDNASLRVIPHPRADHFLPAVATRNERHLAYSKQQGCKMDQQVTAVVKAHVAAHVPLRAFYDADHLTHFVKRHFGTPLSDAQGKQVRSLRNLRNSLLPETEHLLRLLDRLKLDPVSTQDVLAKGKLGTRADLICTDETGAYRVIELKNGCSSNYTHGRRMSTPFQDQLFSTHAEHVLQTLVTNALYRSTHLARTVGMPLLIRVDKQGAYVYHPPKWAVDGLPSLMRMLC